MESWQLSALIALLAMSFSSIFGKIIVMHYNVASQQAFSSFITFLFFILIFPIFSDTVNFTDTINIFKYLEIFAIISGIVIGLGMFFLFSAVSLVDNPGIVTTLNRSQLIFTYFVGLIIFKQNFNFNKFFGILLIIIAVFIQIGKQLIFGKFKNSKWILFTLLSATCGTLLDTISKLSMKKITLVQFNIITFLFSSLTAVTIQYLQDGTFGLQKKKLKENEKNISKISILNKTPPIILLLLSTILFATFKYYLNQSIKLSSNPAFPRSIVGGNFIIVLFSSIFLFKKASIKMNEIIAAIIMLIGILIVTFSN